MIDALVYPDAFSVVFDLIDGTQHLGATVQAFAQQPVDLHGVPTGPYPVAVVYVTGGTEGFLDRVDRVTVEVYAEGRAAVNTLESIRASILGTDIDTPSGYVDAIKPVTTPADVPYQSETLNKAVATFEVISRPVN